MQGRAVCLQCKSFLPLEVFPLHCGSQRPGKCSRCLELFNTAVRRLDLKPVKYIMEAVRRDEQRKGAYSSVAFIMQLQDFKVWAAAMLDSCVVCLLHQGQINGRLIPKAYMTHQVLLELWLCRSALSESDEDGLWRLRLPRWNSQLEWSPWNCVLLTAQEALAHSRLQDPQHQVYAAELVGSVRRRHLQARRLFNRLLHQVPARN